MIDLEPAREVLRADGIDIELIRLEGSTAHLQLHVVDADCAECVLPRQMLELVVLDLLRPGHPELGAVCIVDPRETSAAAGEGA
jgi:hypothetical protein